SPRPYIAYGYFLWTTRRVAEAEAAFKRALILDPKNVLANRITASLLLSTRRLTEAEPYLKSLAASDSPSRLALADYYLVQPRFEDAEQSLGAWPGSGALANEVAVRFAAIRLAQGRIQEANDTIDGVLRADPNNPSALLTKAEVLVAQDRPAEAVP